MRVKNVQLKNFNLKQVKPFRPNKDIEIKWDQEDKDSKQNNDTYASIIGNNKAEINKQLSKLSKNLQSERVRTLNNVPMWRIINTVQKRIY